MKNKLLRNVFIWVCLIVLSLTGICLALMYYYKQSFVVNTWVNDIYCTGMSVEEVNKELLQTAQAPFLTIRDREGMIYKLSTEELGFHVDYTKELNILFEAQREKDLTKTILNESDVEIEPQISLDTETVLNWVSKLDFIKTEEKKQAKLVIEKSESGYVLIDTLKDRLDEEALYTYISTLLKDDTFLSEGYQKGNYEITLSDIDCYRDIVPDAAQQETIKKWTILEEYINCGITYDMGDQMISLSGKYASDFITTDESGNVVFDPKGQPVINEKAIDAFVNFLADEYNTWKKELVFTSTAGKEITIPYINYGTEIDIKKEILYLKKAFQEKKSEIHIPAYTHEGYVRGKNDIGDTYIEVDMGNQRLYAYLEGELIAETDIVTGDVKKKMSTPEGVVYIYKKQRNRTLRGPGYASFVKYWMPVRGGIGLHDAGWRKKFGGEIYKTSGSHGCINIPKDIMPEIYENFDIGTPVIMFY